MYNLHRLEWHLGDRGESLNPAEYCVVLSDDKRTFDSPQSLVVALAKSQDHRAFCGVFAFADRTPHVSSESAWTAWKKTPHSDTPQSKRRPALIWRLVKHLVHGGKQGQMYKRTNPSSALGAVWFFLVDRS